MVFFAAPVARGDVDAHALYETADDLRPLLRGQPVSPYRPLCVGQADNQGVPPLFVYDTANMVAWTTDLW